jgi:hypothetical protein
MTNTTFNMSAAYTGTPHHGFIVSFLQWYNRQNMKIVFTNNTMLNIQFSFYRPLLLDAYYSQITVNNNYWYHITSAVDVALIHTIKNVTLNNNKFEIVSSTSQNVMIIQGASMATINGFNMSGADPVVVSSSILNLNLASGAEAYLSNIFFTGNIFSGTKAIVT